MARKPPLSAIASPNAVLERSEVVPALIGRHEHFLIISGLGGTACDVGAVTGDRAHVYSLAGAMGAACMMGLGLALARAQKRVLVVTGDGELLMNIGALASIAVDFRVAEAVDSVQVIYGAIPKKLFKNNPTYWAVR